MRTQSWSEGRGRQRQPPVRARRAIVVLLSPAALLLPILACAGNVQSHAQESTPAPRVDHHQHLLSPALAKVWAQPEPVVAERLLQQLDEAGMHRAVVMSLAYAWGSPALSPRPDDELMAVRAENDWTAEQAATYPDRLTGLCSVNPLRDY